MLFVKPNRRIFQLSTLTCLILCLFQINIGFAQPEPCTDPPTMTSRCIDACIICDIDGFTGRNGTGGVGQAPPGFCTTELHNAKWIAFIAGSVDLKIRLSVSNCTQTRGLELGIYEGIDCQNYKLVSNCRGGANTPVNENTSAIFQNIVPLTIGQYYYIVMDGSNGSVCDWTFDVVEGSTQVPLLSTSGIIDGPSFACSNGTDQFTTSGQVGATIFDWTLNGIDIGGGQDQDIEVNWTQPGSYQVCVTASNACDKAPPSCKTVIVRDVLKTNIVASICEGSTYVVDDNTLLSLPGEYDYQYLDQFGCDSLVHISLSLMNVNVANITANICAGDSIYIGNTPFFKAGQFTEMIQTATGCDSIVNLNLSLIICEIKGTVVEQKVKCYGGQTGTLTFAVDDGTPPFDYTWNKINSTVNGIGTLAGINQEVQLSGLSAGTYLITIRDQFGNDAVIIGTVTQPEVLAGNAKVSDYKGTNISCPGGDDGIIEIQVTGGTSPFNYAWDNATNNSSLAGLSAGTYTVTISDANDCPLIIESTLNEPLPLILSHVVTDPSCDGLNTGKVEVATAGGGTEPYKFNLNNGNYSSATLFNSLAEGTYVLNLQDANGCISTAEFTLTGAIIPDLTLGDDVTIKLSEEILLTASANIPLDDIVWNPPTGLSCISCPEPIARPFIQTTYFATVTSMDGCITSDSITIRVDESRRVFVPNVFSPNNDGINDQFSINAGPEVTRILSLRVYTRWGAVVYEDLQFDPHLNSHGWDGRFKGTMMENGVFAWSALVEFLDGETRLLKGDLSLIR